MIEIKDALFYIQHRAFRSNDDKKVESRLLKVGQIARVVSNSGNFEVGELVMCFGQTNYIVSLHTGKYACSPGNMNVIPLQPSEAVTLVTK